MATRKHSYGQRKLIYSPDTDVYHIGLTSADLALHDVIIQLSLLGMKSSSYT